MILTSVERDVKPLSWPLAAGLWSLLSGSLCNVLAAVRSLPLPHGRDARAHIWPQGRLVSMLRRCCLTVLFIAFGLAMIVPGVSLAAGKPNIVLVTLSSTRADRMGFLGAKTKTSPHLDNLAGQSLVFEQAFSQAPLTVVSHATILSGTYPQTNRASEFGSRLAATLPFLPDLLHARGYRTAAFVGSIALDPKNGFAPGFDRGFSTYDAGFQSFGQDRAKPIPPPVRPRRSWLVAPHG